MWISQGSVDLPRVGAPNEKAKGGKEFMKTKEVASAALLSSTPWHALLCSLFHPLLDWSRVAMTASPIYSTTALKEEIELSKC